MRRNGLTIVEVVVVIFLIAVVIGLLLPALQRTSLGPAARTQTNNNLKQCALAVHNYHDIYRRLPDGFFTGGIYAKSERSMWFHLLPYVESDNIYKMGFSNEIVPSYNAPADVYNSDNSGIVNFAANIRVFGHETITPEKANEPGVAVDVPEGTMKSGLTLPRIVDGTTNVIMLTTRYSRCSGQTTWYASDASGKHHPFGPPNAVNKQSPTAPPSPGVGGFMGAGTYTTPPTSAATPLTAMFQLVPTQANCVPQPALYGHAFGAGGLSVALCDASVKNIATTMTPRTFSMAISPGDSQKLAEDWNDN